MDQLLWLGIVISTFIFMEFNAWFMHKYIMHGFLWKLHKDHHKKDHKSWFERNDAFFLFYAILSIASFFYGKQVPFQWDFLLELVFFYTG